MENFRWPKSRLRPGFRSRAILLGCFEASLVFLRDRGAEIDEAKLDILEKAAIRALGLHPHRVQ